MSGIVDYLNKLRRTIKPGAEDASDRLNFTWTPFILIICSLTVFGKEYISKPMYCFFSPNTMAQHNRFDDFAENFCWAHGTYAYSKDLTIKLSGFRNQEEQEQHWKENSDQLQIYYQWVPFFLLLQCTITYMPKLIWQLICGQRFGTDLYSLVGLAAETKTSDCQEFGQQAARIADVIERMLLYNREFRNGRLQQMKSAIYNRCSFLLPSKRTGTMLTVLYITVKLLCLANAIGQVVLMAVFLGFWHQGVLMFGWLMLQNLSSGRGWQETQFFPLRTLCYVTVVDLGAVNGFVGQCTLPVNILNEKIFIMLFFWFLFVGLFTVLSIARWLCRLLCSCNRVSFIKRFLRLSDPHLRADKATVKAFIDRFLRHDGVFLVMLLGEGSDKVITTEVVRLLYQRWRDKHHGCDLRTCELTTAPETLVGRSQRKIRQRSQATRTPPETFDSACDDTQKKIVPCESTAIDESGLLSV